MHTEDDVNALDRIDSDSNVDMERDGDDKKEEDEVDKDEEVEEEEDEDKDEDEDDGKQPHTIGQGEMVNTSAGNVDTMVDDLPTVRHEQGQEMREHSPQPEHSAPASQPQIPDPHPRPVTPVTYPHSGPEFLGLVTPLEPRPASLTLPEADAAGNTSVANVDQLVLGQLAGGDSLTNVPLPDVPLPNIPHPVGPLPEVRLVVSVGEE